MFWLYFLGEIHTSIKSISSLRILGIMDWIELYSTINSNPGTQKIGCGVLYFQIMNNIYL